MKRIGIDARLYFKTGVGVYIRNLLFYLQKYSPPNLEFYVYVLHEDSEKIQFHSPNFVKREVNSKWHTISEQMNFLYTLYQDKLDLMHFTYFSYPLLYKRKFIATIHDTILFEHKTGKASTKGNVMYQLKYFFFKKVFLSQLKNSLHIITPTHTVKQSIVKLFGEKYEKKIDVLYEGIDHDLATIDESKNLDIHTKNQFFMYVGNFYPHKNVEKLIRAFARIDTNTKLILIGPDDFFSETLKKIIKNLNQTDRIIFVHNISSSDLAYYYKHSLALIHPSLSEGFGIPLIEAAYFGLPIIASDIEVFHELLGKSYISMNSNNEDAIKNIIENYIKHPVSIDYSNIISRFSFEEMSKRILLLYQKYL